MITAKTITDAQLRALAGDADMYVRVQAKLALDEAVTHKSDARRACARERCAEILNERAVKFAPIITPPAQVYEIVTDERPQVEWQTGNRERRKLDPAVYPFTLHARLAPPEFMIVAFVGLYGGMEELHIRGKSREHLDLVVEEIKRLPRFRRMTITGPDNFSEEISR